MAKTLQTNVSQAIADFDAIKASLEKEGFNVGTAATNEYGAIVSNALAHPIITDGSYLFYKGARTDIAKDLLKKCKGLTNMSFMFSNAWITDPEIFEMVGELDTSQVTTLESFFASNGQTGALDVSKWDTSKVTTMKSMFSGWYSLSEFIIGDSFGGAVTDISGMFYQVRYLTELDLKNFDVSNVTTMYQTFSGCSAIETLDLTGWNTSKVTNMGSMFSGCTKATSMPGVKDFDTSNVTNMAQIFINCAALPTEEFNAIFANWDTSKVTAMNQIFQNCTTLESIDLSKMDTSSVTTMSSMFSGCTSLREITGFSSVCKSGLSGIFPYGTSSKHLPLKRLTFRTDLEEGKYAISSAIDIRYCSFTRNGLVEMFNTLPDISSLSINSGYKKISITGNPCLFEEITLNKDSSSYVYQTYKELRTALASRYCGYDYQNAPLQYRRRSATVGDWTTCTFAEFTEDIFNSEEWSVYFLADTITVPVEDRLTDEDRAIATNKGWTLVET